MTQLPPMPYSIARLSGESGLSQSTIQRRITAGTIHATKFGPGTAPWMIPADEAARVIAEAKAAAA